MDRCKLQKIEEKHIIISNNFIIKLEISKKTQKRYNKYV
jgi:hypothetical protein